MFDASEWLMEVESAARRAQIEETWLSTLPSPSHSGISSQMSDPDRMTGLVARREASAQRLSEAEAVVRSARAVFEGMRSVGPMLAVAANIMEMRHADLVAWDAICRKLSVSRSSCMRRYHVGVDWLDAHGLAHAKEGTGAAS